MTLQGQGGTDQRRVLQMVHVPQTSLMLMGKRCSLENDLLLMHFKVVSNSKEEMS